MMEFSQLNSMLNIQEVIDSEIIESGACVGWHVVVSTNEGIIGGGVNASKNTARRIAISEVVERKLFRQIFDSDSKSEFFLNEFPTTCGFAAGFEKEKTRFRSISEAVERWVWSKWIDEGYHIPQVGVCDQDLSVIGKSFVKKFDQVLFFQRSILTKSISDYVPSVKMGIVLGIKDGGIFPGSRVASQNEDIWEHGLVEAYRHLLIFNQKKNEEHLAFPYNRIVHFGHNSASALSQIKRAKEIIWPEPRLLFERAVNHNLPGVEAHRAILNDYLGWEKGSVNRFVY